MKFDCPNGVKLEINPASGVTVRVLPDGTMEVDGRRKARGVTSVAVALAMACAVGVGFVTSDLIQRSSDRETAVAADNLARYSPTEAPRIRGAEPPEWLLRMPQYGAIPPAENVPTNRGQPAAPSVEVPAPRQEPQSPFGLDTP